MSFCEIDGSKVIVLVWEFTWFCMDKSPIAAPIIAYVPKMPAGRWQRADANGVWLVQHPDKLTVL